MAVVGFNGPVEFEVLGGLAVHDADRVVDLGTPKQRSVLAVLLLERDRVVPTERLLELLWPDEDPDRARVGLQAYVSKLRTALEPSRRKRDAATVLLSQPPGYRLAVARDQLDLCRFEDAVAAGRARLREGEHASALVLLRAALDLWAGPLLPELAEAPYVVGPALRIAELHLTAIEATAEAHLGLGDAPAAAELLWPETELNRTRERLHGLLALALYRTDHQAEALRVIDQCRRALVDEAGLTIGPSLQRLETDILGHASSLHWQPPLREPPGSQPAPSPAPPEPVSTAPNPAPGVASAVRAQRQQAAAAARQRPRPPILLVGRDAERTALTDALHAAGAGEGGIALVMGDAGVGKTSLVEALVEQAAASGVATAWVRCPEGRITPPHWLLRALADQLPFPDLPLDRLTADAGAAPIDLHRAVVGWLASFDAPAVLVIDDLQWADPDSLRALEAVASERAASHALLVATMRPLEPDAPTALVDFLGEAARHPFHVSLALGGLDVGDVRRWLTHRLGADVGPEIALTVHDRTAGNSLFVHELIELLAAEAMVANQAGEAAIAEQAKHLAGSSIPPGVQFVVRRRVSRLPRETQRVLGIAAVVGAVFSPATVAAAAGVGVGDVLSMLSPALDAGLLGAQGNELAFSHAVVADALAGEVNPARRAAVHAAVARHLAADAGGDVALAAPMIAHHALAGMLAGTGDLAVEASTAAARQAAARLAHEDAAAHWAAAAAALASARPTQIGERIHAGIEQARALLRADRVLDSKRPIVESIQLAFTAGLVDAAVEAASLVNHVHVWPSEPYGIVDQQLVAAIEQVLSMLPPDRSSDEAVVLGALALELCFAPRERHRAVCTRAEQVARATGDPIVLARVLSALVSPYRSDDLERARACAVELRLMADEASTTRR